MKFTKEDNVEDLPESLRNYLPKYLNNRSKDLLELEIALDNHDVQSISSLCHRINGTAANYGLFQLEELSRNLQKVAKENNFKAAKELVNDMHSYLEQTTVRFVT